MLQKTSCTMRGLGCKMAKGEACGAKRADGHLELQDPFLHGTFSGGRAGGLAQFALRAGWWESALALAGRLDVRLELCRRGSVALRARGRHRKRIGRRLCRPAKKKGRARVGRLCGLWCKRALPAGSAGRHEVLTMSTKPSENTCRRRRTCAGVSSRTWARKTSSHCPSRNCQALVASARLDVQGKQVRGG